MGESVEPPIKANPHTGRPEPEKKMEKEERIVWWKAELKAGTEILTLSLIALFTYYMLNIHL
jgi:hypothetical protein